MFKGAKLNSPCYCCLQKSPCMTNFGVFTAEKDDRLVDLQGNPVAGDIEWSKKISFTE